MDTWAIRRTRPVPVSTAVVTQVGVLANIRVELPVQAGCGYADQQHMVICLDADWRMSDAEQLRLLAFAADPYRISAGSRRALDVVHDLVVAKVESPYNALETIRTIDGCTGACERRIEVAAQ